MDIKYDKLDDVTGKIVITLEENDYADKVKQEMKQLKKTHKEPGFREGHVPEGLLRKKYGDSIKYKAVTDMIGEALHKYINENNLKVLGNPLPAESNIFKPEDTTYTFEFTVGLAPEINVHINKEMHIPYYTIKVSDEMINEQDAGLRRRFGKQEPGEEVNEDAVVKGVITELNEDGTVKEGGIVQENGIVAPKWFKDEEQRALFAGKHVGDEIVFNPSKTCEANATEMSSMLGIDKGDVDAHLGNFRFDIKEIIVLNPAELGEEYYNGLFGPDQVHNEEEYREKLKEAIAGQLVSDQNYRFTVDARKVIEAAAGEVTLPEEILKQYLISNNEEITEENVDETYKQSVNGLVWEIIADEFAREKDIKLEEADLLNVAKQMARNEFMKYGMAQVPEESLEKYAKEMLKDDSVRRRIAKDAFEMKVFGAIHDSVTLDNKEVSVEEFNALFAPATEE